MDIVSKETIDILLEVVCGIMLLAILSFTIYGSYITPILEHLF